MTPTLDAARNRLKKATALLNPAAAAENAAPVKKAMDKAAFDAYVSEQIAKATKDSAEVAKSRLAALAATMQLGAETLAKATTVDVELFQDPPAPETALSKYIGVLKSLHSELTKKDSELAAAITKSKNGKELVKKAGMSASALLEKVAKMFGYDLATLQAHGSSLSWKVETAVSALENAARLEKVMNGLESVIGGVTKADTDDEDEEQGKAPTKKSATAVWGSSVSDLSAQRAESKAAAGAK
jgi:hypothetical protein